jgi:hypothetical protein
VGVADLNDVAEFSVGRRWTTAFDVSISLGRCDEHKTLRPVLVCQLRHRRALGPAFRAPMRPEKDEHDLALQLIEVRHMRADVCHMGRMTEEELDAAIRPLLVTP